MERFRRRPSSCSEEDEGWAVPVILPLSVQRVDEGLERRVASSPSPQQKTFMEKSYPCYLTQVTTDFRSGPETSSTMLTQHDRKLAIQVFKNCIKQKQSQKIMNPVHVS